jgi:hypothetical protein
MIATVDITDRAAGHPARRDFIGHTVETILDPEDVTMNEVTLALGAALGIPNLRYVEFPPDGVKAALLGAGISEEVRVAPGGDAARRERGSDDGRGEANG